MAEGDWLDALQRQALTRLERRLRQTLLPAYTARVRAAWTPYPTPVKYPIAWKSERQRRAFFATNGFGGGIPYRRTGALGRGWEWTLVREPDGFLITIANRAPAARFVIGLDQQPFHAATGWPKPGAADAQRVADDLAGAVVATLQEAFR